MTKVHIAYDDGDLVGVYRTKSAAAHQLSLHAAWVGCVRLIATTVSFDDWNKTENRIERRVDTPNGRGWEQWIDTHEVTK